MKEYKPYILWTKEELSLHCEKQLLRYGCTYMHVEIKDMIYDTIWNPIYEYNGCNMVQDKYHPYVPCLIHDYRYVNSQGGLQTDREFRKNLIKFGTKYGRAWRLYIGVRLGWIFYGQFKFK